MTIKDINRLKKEGKIESEANFKVAKAWKGLKGETVLGLFPNEIDKLWYIYEKHSKKLYKYQSTKEDLKLPSEMLEDFSSVKYQITLQSMKEVIIQDEVLGDSRLDNIKKVIKLLNKQDIESALEELEILKQQFS